jgi:hypothetical protein
VTVAGGNLYSLASREYGDATLWYIVAAANDLTDPMLDGVWTLRLPAPPTTGSNGGILDAL